MAGGAELEQLSHELEGVGGAAAEIGHAFEEEATELGIGQPPATPVQRPATPAAAPEKEGQSFA
jgi:hypothetical protein